MVLLVSALVCTALGLLALALQPVARLISGRQVQDRLVPHDGWYVLVPLLVGAMLFVWAAWASRRRTRAELSRVRGSAERLAAGDMSARAPLRSDDPDVRALSHALNRLAGLHEATSAVLLDRDAQLGALRSLGGAVYWESDPLGRYTRIELPHAGRRPEIAQLLGRLRWDDGAVLADGSDWDAHRAVLQRRESFSGLVVRRRGYQGDAFFVAENGQPRIADDGTLVGWVGILREVTAEVALQRDHRLALGALRTTLEPTLLIESLVRGPGWRIAWANQAACAMFERLESELLAMPPATLFSRADGGFVSRIEAALQEGNALKLALSVPTRYGESRPVSVRMDPFPDDSGAPRRGVLMFDALGPEVDRLKRAVAAAEQLRREAAARSLDLEVTAKELESFSYTVSHDLRAPLRVVEGFAKIVQEDYGHALDRMANEHLNRILSASNRMNSMIDALLALSNLSAKPVVPEEVEVSRLAAAVVDELRAAEPNREVGVSIQPGLKARGDPTLLRVVLQNLLGNAWKYTSRSPHADIGLTCEFEPDRAIFCVWDNGVGFDMRFADRLFGVFQRLHSASDFPGTGIGLATVQRIIRRHGGRVWAQSEPGTGARFYFTLWERDL
jgi:signal transduction histidine kinase/HAMP domain-containing protein